LKSAFVKNPVPAKICDLFLDKIPTCPTAGGPAPARRQAGTDRRVLGLLQELLLVFVVFLLKLLRFFGIY